MSPNLFQQVKQHLQEMVQIGAIKKSFNPWAGAVVLVRKKHDEIRFCIDPCKFKNRAIKGGYAIPKIEYTLICLHVAILFSSLDPKSG